MNLSAEGSALKWSSLFMAPFLALAFETWSDELSPR